MSRAGANCGISDGAMTEGKHLLRSTSTGPNITMGIGLILRHPLILSLVTPHSSR